MATKLIYHLHHEGYTVYHRAALGGLAATVYAWQHSHRDIAPDGIHCDLNETTVTLQWDDVLQDTDAMERILKASFRLTEKKLIDLPGMGLRTGDDSSRVAIHNAITGTFLQHPKMRPGEKEPRKINIADADHEESALFISYKAINSYAHQKAQGTGLLDSPGKMLAHAKIPQSVIPGAMSGSLNLEASGEEVFLLLYLMVGCPLYLLRSKTHEEKAQYCVLVPDVTKLKTYAKSIHEWAKHPFNGSFSHDYASRIAGGAEEAAMRFLVDLTFGKDISPEWTGVAGCLAIAMGKVAWDGNQINRSLVFPIRADYEEMGIFRAANGSSLGMKRKITLKSGDAFVIPASPVPALIAANLTTANRHWCSGFIDLVKEQKEFKNMMYEKGGFQKMKEAIKNNEDRLIIEAIHEAWYRTLGQMGERAKQEGADFFRLVEVEQEKMRNAILRMKSSELLAGWFMQFCAAATKGAPLLVFQENKAQVVEFIFNKRNYDRFRSLCLFALLSYEAHDK